MAGKIWVALDPETVQVDAGGEPAAVVVAVQNLGTTVDHLSIEIQGLETSWVSFSSTALQLFPNERGQAQIQFQVPRRSDVHSGSYPFTVKVSSRTDPTEIGTAQGVMDIRPYHVYRFDVMPKRFLGRQGRYRTIIQNTGTADVQPQLQGKDPEAMCRFNFQTDRPRVAPGADATVRFTVKPRRSSLVGEPKTFNLTISATSGDEADAKSIPVQFIHQPLLRSWGPLVWLVSLSLIAIVVITALFWPGWLQPDAGNALSSGWNSIQLALCRITGHRIACPSGISIPDVPSGASTTKIELYENFNIYYEADPRIIGEPVGEEWKDRYGNGHQRTTTGQLLWISRTNTLYFLASDMVFSLNEKNRMGELKPR